MMGIPQEDVLSVKPKSATSTQGVEYRLPLRSKKATVVLFLSAECPIGNRYAPEIARIESEFRPKGIGFVHVYPSDGSDAEAVKRHAKEFAFKSPGVMDPKAEFAKWVGATVTPEAAILLPNGALAYRGRIDAANIEHGRIVPNYRRDLRIALDEVLAGKPVTEPRTAAVGCFISPPGR